MVFLYHTPSIMLTKPCHDFYITHSFVHSILLSYVCALFEYKLELLENMTVVTRENESREKF